MFICVHPRLIKKIGFTVKEKTKIVLHYII